MSDQYTDPSAEQLRGAPEVAPGFSPLDYDRALPVRLVPEPADRGLVSLHFDLPAAAGGVVDAQLGTFVRCMRVDNPTGRWWYCPSADAWIEPYTLGMVVPLYGVERLRIIQQDPPGARLASSVAAGEMGVVRVYDKDIPYSPGRKIAAQTAGGAAGFITATI